MGHYISIYYVTDIIVNVGNVTIIKLLKSKPNMIVWMVCNGEKAFDIIACQDKE